VNYSKLYANQIFYCTISEKRIQRIFIKTRFQNFFNHYGYLELEQALELFAVFGGVEEALELDFFDDLDSIVRFNFVENIKFLMNSSPLRIS